MLKFQEKDFAFYVTIMSHSFALLHYPKNAQLDFNVTFAFSSFAFYTHFCTTFALSHFSILYMFTFALSHFITSVKYWAIKGIRL